MKRKIKSGYGSFKVVPLPEPNQHPYPPLINGMKSPLPKHEFTCALIAPPGKGKTTTAFNMMEKYTGYFHNMV